jgi:D-alanyl-D-alanine carboxypeptidase
MYITALCMLIIAGIAFFAMRQKQDEGEISQPPTQPSLPTAQPSSPPVEIEIVPPPEDDPFGGDDDIYCTFYEEESPILVNRNNPVPDDYDPDLVGIANGFSLNFRAAHAWNEMQAAALEDGIVLWVISAYRSNEAQTRNFNNRMAQYMDAGWSQDEAHARTAVWIAVPGTSEHELGLAIDINSLGESFEDTDEFAWLMENSAEFGFILRYTRDKTHITGINYEPWHFRYVGSNHARAISSLGITLEEYLGEATYG